MEYEIYTDGELYHWGVRGMRWGVRRYQNKDGSLTKAGQRRYNKEAARLKAEEQVIKNKERTQTKLSKLTKKEAELEARNRALKNGKKQDDESTSTPRKKGIGDMTDDELREKTNRMILEKNYHDAQKNLAASNPPKVSTGKKFVKGLMDEIIVPTAKSVGKSWIENKLKDKLGLNDTDPLKAIENEAKKYKSLKEIEEYKNTINKLRTGDKDSEYPEVKSWDDLIKRDDYFEKKRKREEADN